MQPENGNRSSYSQLTESFARISSLTAAHVKNIETQTREYATQIDNKARTYGEYLDDDRSCYYWYGGKDGLNLAYSGEKYFFDLLHLEGGSAAWDAMHDWMLTPLGAFVTVLNIAFMITCSTIANGVNGKTRKEYEEYKLAKNTEANKELKTLYVSLNSDQSLISCTANKSKKPAPWQKQAETAIEIETFNIPLKYFGDKEQKIKDALSATTISDEEIQTLILKATSDRDYVYLTSPIANNWQDPRNIMKAAKYSFKGTRSIIYAAKNMYGVDCREYLVPASITLGILSAINRIWLKRMRNNRKIMMSENSKLFDKIRDKIWDEKYEIHDLNSEEALQSNDEKNKERVQTILKKYRNKYIINHDKLFFIADNCEKFEVQSKDETNSITKKLMEILKDNLTVYTNTPRSPLSSRSARNSQDVIRPDVMVKNIKGKKYLELNDHGFMQYVTNKSKDNHNKFTAYASYVESATKKQDKLEQYKGLLAAICSAIFDSPYLYLGVAGLTTQFLPATFAIMMYLSLVFVVACIAARLYEEIDYQRLLTIKQLRIELALCAKTHYGLKEMSAKIITADSTNYGLQHKTTLARHEALHKDLRDQLNTSYGGAIMIGLKRGVSAYSMVTNMLYAASTLYMMQMIPMSATFVSGCIIAGITILLVCIIYSLANTYLQKLYDAPLIEMQKLALRKHNGYSLKLVKKKPAELDKETMYVYKDFANQAIYCIALDANERPQNYLLKKEELGERLVEIINDQQDESLDNNDIDASLAAIIFSITKQYGFFEKGCLALLAMQSKTEDTDMIAIYAQADKDKEQIASISSFIIDDASDAAYSFENWTEVGRAFFSAIAKAQKSIDYTLSPFQEPDADGHFQAVAFMRWVAIAMILIYVPIDTIREVARSLGRQAPGKETPKKSTGPSTNSSASSPIPHNNITTNRIDNTDLQNYDSNPESPTNSHNNTSERPKSVMNYHQNQHNFHSLQNTREHGVSSLTLSSNNQPYS